MNIIKINSSQPKNKARGSKSHVTDHDDEPIEP